MEHEDRSTYLGSHSPAQLLGKSPWGGKVQIYQQALKILPETKPNLSMKIGLLYEEKAVELYEMVTGKKVVDRQKFYRHPICEFIGCTQDGFIDGTAEEPAHGVDVKIGNPMMMKEWGDEDEQVPVQYFLQAHHFMNIRNVQRWDLFVSIGTYQKNHIIRWNQEVGQMCMKACIDAWQEIQSLKILKDKEPAVFAERMLKIAAQDEEAKAQILNATWPFGKESAQVPEEHYGLFERMIEVYGNYTAEEGNVEQLKNQMKEAMKDVGRWKGPGGEIVWTGSPRKFYVRPDKEHKT